MNMTEEQLIDIGRRAVACKGWRWMPGMLALDSADEEHPGRVIDDRKSLVYEDADGAIREGVASRSDVPDLTDPATLGCLLALVREAWGEPLASVEVRQPGDLGCRACVRVPVGSEGWRVVQWWCASQDPQYSEAAALVAALEACNGA
jgi:hypothetical protein